MAKALSDARKHLRSVGGQDVDEDDDLEQETRGE